MGSTSSGTGAGAGAGGGYGKEVVVPLLIQKTNECIIRTTAIEEKIFA